MTEGPIDEVVMMKRMQTAWSMLCLVALATALCGFPRLAELLNDSGESDGAPTPVGLELLAGNIGGSGNADGIGAAARFGRPFDRGRDGPVATGERGYQIHRRHRDPGTHPVARRRFFASTVPRRHARGLEFAVRTE